MDEWLEGIPVREDSDEAVRDQIVKLEAAAQRLGLPKAAHFLRKHLVMWVPAIASVQNLYAYFCDFGILRG